MILLTKIMEAEDLLTKSVKINDFAYEKFEESG